MVSIIPYGAPIPLEMTWPSGIGANSMVLAAAVICTVLAVLALRARYQGAKRPRPILAPIGGGKPLHQVAA